MVMQQVGVRAVVEGTGAYVSDAERINTATGRIGDTALRAERESRRMAERLRATGSRMREAGTQAIFLGGALAAPGIAAAVMAASFEESFTRIETLVGIAADQVAEFRTGVLALSRETARSPQELAAALFIVTSAGIRGAEALDVLGAAARASAVGLGDTGTIARTVTSAVQAFSDQNLSAAAATDILLATVREGNLVASELAGSLSRVLGPAAQLGVQFADVGSFVATFTRLGGDAAEATTALRGIFSTLIKPTSGAREALDAVGLSAEELRRQIREEGLAQTLITLIEAFEGNEEGIAQVIPNIRALTGVLNTAGVQADEFVRIQGSVRDSLGATDAAFERAGEDAARRFREALNDLRIELLDLGVDVLPAVSGLIDAIGFLVDRFTDLPGPVKTAAIVFVTLTGAALVLAGTLGIVAGSALSLIALFSPGMVVAAGAAASALTALAAAAAPFLLGGAAVAGIGLLGVAIVKTLNEASSEADDFSRDTRQALEGGTEAIREQLSEWIGLRDAIQADIETFREAGRDTSALEQQVEQLNEDIAALTAELNLQSSALEDEAAAFEAGRGAAADFAGAQAALAGTVDATTAAINAQVEALREQRAQAAITAAAAEQIQRDISEEQALTAGRGERAGFLGGALGLLTPEEERRLRESTAEFHESRRPETVGGGGGIIDQREQALRATRERQLREQVESFLSAGEPGLQRTISLQRRLDQEFARFAQTLRDRFGVEIPEIFRDMFDQIRGEALEAGRDVPNDLGNLLSFLIARRLGRGLPGGAGLVAVPPALATAGPAGGGQQITIEQINVGAGTTVGDIQQGVGVALRSSFGSVG